MLLRKFFFVGIIHEQVSVFGFQGKLALPEH
jgi:hypothetical protein